MTSDKKKEKTVPVFAEFSVLLNPRQLPDLSASRYSCFLFGRGALREWLLMT
ncbi:MAG: hypothetical protein OXC17_10870 [Aestuariivita sp.]|nr:hypothetical protein [Aestuariivita sp.]